MARDNAARGLALKAVPHPGYIAGNWYAPPVAGTVAAGGALSIGSVRLIPFYLSKTITVSDLGCQITTLAAAGNIRLAIYRGDPATGRPTGTAVVETGNISTAAAGALSAAVTAAATLAPGLYFMAVNSDNATVVLQCLTTAQTATTMLVGSTTFGNIANAASGALLLYTFASAFGAFPDLTGQTLVENNSTANSWGLVYMKAA